MPLAALILIDSVIESNAAEQSIKDSCEETHPLYPLPILRVGKKVIFRLLTIVAGLVISVGLVEVGLRIVGWPAPGLYQNGNGPIALRAPGHNGGAYPPNVSGHLKHYDYDVEWVVNSYGFRDRSLEPKAPSEWRVGIVGDSFSAGVGVENSDRFSDVWYSRIRQQYANVTLWNLSSPACGTACEAEILDGVGRQYDLDEILLAFYSGNDAQDNYEWSQEPSPQIPQESLSSCAKDWLRLHSRFATFLWVYGIRAFANFDPPGIYSEAELRRYWPYTEKALARFQSITHSRPLTILYIPNVAEWDDNSWQKIRERFQLSDDARFLLKQSVAAWAQRNSVRFIDSTPWLRQCQPANECVFPVDGHWTAHAHARVGSRLAEFWQPERNSHGK